MCRYLKNIVENKNVFIKKSCSRALRQKLTLGKAANPDVQITTYNDSIVPYGSLPKRCLHANQRGTIDKAVPQVGSLCQC